MPQPRPQPHAGCAGSATANGKIGVGFIGYGLIGKRHVLDFQAQPDVNMVAVSDCHAGRLEEAKAQIGGGVRGYADFRKLLDDRDVEAVVISTPDHWHALMTMLACAAGKDVYVEKPVTLFPREGPWMLRSGAAAQARRAGRHAAAVGPALRRRPQADPERAHRQGRQRADAVVSQHHARLRPAAGRAAAGGI